MQTIAHLCRDLHHSVWPGLPGNNCHLLLNGLHVWRLIWLRPVCECHDSLGVLALLLCPVLQKPARSKSALSGSCSMARAQVEEAERPGSVIVGPARLLTCSSNMTYLYSIFERAGSSNCSASDISGQVRASVNEEITSIVAPAYLCLPDVAFGPGHRNFGY